MPTAKISPQSFATGHRKLVEDVVAPAAKRLKVKTLNTKLENDLFGRRDAPDVKVVLDNLKEIGDHASRALPLKELYDTSETMALQAAKDAARASGGVLDAKSARFLPFEYQADFEKVTGLTIDDKPGAAVKGVKITLSGKSEHVEIDFKQALAGAKSDKLILGLTNRAAIIAEKVDPPADKGLPPYWVYISARPGKNEDRAALKRDSGISGFSEDSGSLIFAGTSKIEVVDFNQTDKVFGTMTFKLDQVNDIGSRTKEPSDKTKAVRGAWLKRFNKTDNVFDLSKLPKLTRAEFEALPGAKTLLSAIRESFNTSISRLIKDERLELRRDPASKSAVAYVYADGEAESWLHVLDEKSKRWVGTWDIGDDGTKGWEER